jgi:hypothetical protein
MTHIKYPNELGSPVPYEPNWKNEAMRQNALLHSAMMGSANAEARVAQLELERDEAERNETLCSNMAVNYLERAEDAEAKLEKAFALLKKAHTYITDLEEHEGAEGFSRSTAVAMGEYYDALTELEQTE